MRCFHHRYCSESIDRVNQEQKLFPEAPIAQRFWEVKTRVRRGLFRGVRSRRRRKEVVSG